MSVINLAPTFSTLLETFSANGTGVNLVNTFLVLLSAQIIGNPEYVYPNNYLTKIFPLWSPKFLTIVPDNACQRSKYNSPLVYDFIVVGTGAAGAAVARRLSDNPNWTVLCIEAGDDPLTVSIVPRLFPFGLDDSRVWQYSADVVTTSSRAFVNGCPTKVGRQLGGSTNTNAMLWVCGNDRDYDGWAAQGNTGWDYRSILPFQKRCENNLDSSRVGNGTYHSTGGPVTVSSATYIDKIVPAIRQGFFQMGYKINSDFNSQQYNGYVEDQSTIKGGERCGSYRSYLGPAKTRPNLTFMKKSLVTKVLFTGPIATGVNVLTNIADCPNIKISARKEVILSAGALNSPKILMQSGIGRPVDLNPFNISVVKSLSVGNNLQDHPFAVNFIKVNKDAPTPTLIDLVLNAQEYLTSRTGYFSMLGSAFAEGFLNLTDVNAKYPEVQLTLFRFDKSEIQIKEILADFGFQQQYIDYIAKVNIDFELVLVLTAITNPKSTGTVKLQSGDPTVRPKINTGYFNDPADVKTIIAGINKLQDLINTPAFKNLGADFLKFSLADCDIFAYPSDDYWKCYITYFTASHWHFSGTCKMGPSSDPEAVVDPSLRVHGINNLRVIDASIMPTVPTGNIQCVAYMVGEKGADMVKSAWS